MNDKRNWQDKHQDDPMLSKKSKRGKNTLMYCYQKKKGCYIDDKLLSVLRTEIIGNYA